MRSIHGVMGVINGIRAAVPYIVLPLTLLMKGAKNTNSISFSWAPSEMLRKYGYVVLLSSLFAIVLSLSIYYGAAYLAVLVVAGLIQKNYPSLVASRFWLEVNWIVMTIFACVMIYIGRKYLSLDSESAYGITSAAHDVAGGAMSRSSGVARFAAVPGLVCLCRVITSRSWRKLIWGFVSVVFIYVVYKCQSRGAIFGTLGALPLILLAGCGRIKTMLAVGFLIVLQMFLDPELTTLQKFEEHIRRGQNTEEFKSMTGRTRPWKNAIEAFGKSPIIIGYGNWADRSIINEHVHNAFLQALLFGGLLGLGLYVGSWVAGWYLFLKIIQKQALLAEPDHKLFLEAAAVMAFFTIRSIPETTTASFSVDLMVMVPVFCYLELLYQRLSSGMTQTDGARVCRLILRQIQ